QCPAAPAADQVPHHGRLPPVPACSQPAPRRLVRAGHEVPTGPGTRPCRLPGYPPGRRMTRTAGAPARPGSGAGTATTQQRAILVARCTRHRGYGGLHRVSRIGERATSDGSGPPAAAGRAASDPAATPAPGDAAHLLA